MSPRSLNDLDGRLTSNPDLLSKAVFIHGTPDTPLCLCPCPLPVHFLSHKEREIKSGSSRGPNPLREHLRQTPESLRQGLIYLCWRTRQFWPKQWQLSLRPGQASAPGTRASRAQRGPNPASRRRHLLSDLCRLRDSPSPGFRSTRIPHL